MSLFDRLKKKKADPVPTEEDQTPRHCFVLCRDAKAIQPSQASRIVSDVFGPGFAVDCEDENIMTVSQGSSTVGFIAHLPAPIPDGEAEHKADGNFLWPKGREEVSKHTSHVIVTNIGSGTQSAIESALNVSRLAIVALRLFGGIGVYWGNASVCNSREVFEDFCQNMSADQLPLPVWLRYQPIRASETEIGIYTLGMPQFGLMDIEVDRCKMDFGELFEFVSNLAQYLVQSGPVIADGNTVGGSEAERIIVRHRPSMIDKSKKVYKIVFD
jgi:hypothetical protein